MLPSRNARLIHKLVPRWLLLLVALGVLPAVASAVDRMAADYIRADLTVEDGLPDNVVNAIVQTENGLLWVGTQSGLASFDGREFTPISLQISGTPSQGAVHTLLETSNGDLWVGTHAGVVRIPRRALDQFDPALLTFYHPGSGPGDEVGVLQIDADGALWAGTNHGLYRFDADHFVEVISNVSVSRIGRALNHHLLVITEKGLLDWDGKQANRHPGIAERLGVHEDQIFDAFQDRSGMRWYSTDKGIRREASKPLPPLLPQNVYTTSAFRTYEDGQGRVWVLSGIGVFLVTGDHMETPLLVHARCFLVGKDDELWIGTNGNGLIHLKRRVVTMLTEADGLPNDVAMTVLAAHDGRTWAGFNCGLVVREGNQFRRYKETDGLLNACVWSLAEDRENSIWIGTYGGGVFRFRDDHFTQVSKKQGLVSDVVLQIIVAHDGSLWLATPDGVSHMRDGHIRNYTIADGLSSNQVLSIYQDRAGTVWAATQSGVNRLVDDRFVPLTVAKSKDDPFLISLMQDSLGDLYAAASPKGVGRIDSNRVTMFNEDLKILDMVESPQHDLWFSGTNGIVRVRLDDLRRSVPDRNSPLDYEQIDRADGLNSIQCSVGAPNMAITPDGHLWVATVKGVAVLDLNHRPGASRPSRAFVGEVTIGKDRMLAGGAAVLPPGTHHIELHLKAVDLASPEKVRLQYRLDGVDAGWLDADASRTAVYTNIPTGSHDFHLRASGSDGVWDRTGIVYNITQSPYFYQTLWFRIAAVCLLLLLLTLAYLARVSAIVRQTRMRLEERLEEREHIARELHDTLLQGVLSASMQLDLAEELLPEESTAKPLLSRVLQMLRQVTDEGRNALRGLRAREVEGEDLAISFSNIGREFGGEFGVANRIAYRVISQGTARPLRPQIRNEVYRIGREAITNAFMHAKASSVEVEIEYAGSYFGLLLRDDGCGIDAQVLAAGREGHWGLAGMRERADAIDAELKLRSRIGAGTEVELIIPAATAFEHEPGGTISRWLPWLNRERFERPVRWRHPRRKK